MGRTALGVANASCFAIRDLFSRCTDAPGVILLQDDVVFTANWYERPVGQVGRVFQVGRRQGIVAGIHLDRRQKRRSNTGSCSRRLKPSTGNGRSGALLWRLAKVRRAHAGQAEEESTHGRMIGEADAARDRLNRESRVQQ